MLQNSDQIQRVMKEMEMNSKNIENFSELDCVIHLAREISKANVEKLPRKKGVKTCDFKIQLQQPHYVEVKQINKFAEKTLAENVAYAQEQIESSAKQDGQKDYCAVVWIFTYDTYLEGKDAQEMVERVKGKLTKDHPFLLTVQVYSRGLYGDCTFINQN